MTDDNAAVRHTKKWLRDVIIGHGLCPFAKREFDADRINYAVIETEDLETQLKHLWAELGALDNDPAIETSLLIFPEALQDFDDYLDLLTIANALLKDQGYDGTYQLASFHPDYKFEGEAPNHASHYTNRSPYPMLHILREASVERAVNAHPNAEGIPSRNIELTRGLGLEFMRRLLAGCFE